MMWQYQKEGKVYGPIPQMDLQHLFKEGALEPDTPILSDMITDWQPAKTFRIFARFMEDGTKENKPRGPFADFIVDNEKQEDSSPSDVGFSPPPLPEEELAKAEVSVDFVPPPLPEDFVKQSELGDAVSDIDTKTFVVPSKGDSGRKPLRSLPTSPSEPTPLEVESSKPEQAGGSQEGGALDYFKSATSPLLKKGHEELPTEPEVVPLRPPGESTLAKAALNKGALGEVEPIKGEGEPVLELEARIEPEGLESSLEANAESASFEQNLIDEPEVKESVVEEERETSEDENLDEPISFDTLSSIPKPKKEAESADKDTLIEKREDLGLAEKAPENNDTQNKEALRPAAILESPAKVPTTIQKITHFINSNKVTSFIKQNITGEELVEPNSDSEQWDAYVKQTFNEELGLDEQTRQLNLQERGKENPKKTENEEEASEVKLHDKLTPSGRVFIVLCCIVVVVILLGLGWFLLG